MQNHDTTSNLSAFAAASLVVVAGVLAAGTGALVAALVPPDQSGWVGVALIPFWLVLELLLELLVILFSLPGKPDRLTAGIVVVAGFYAGVLLLPVVAA